MTGETQSAPVGSLTVGLDVGTTSVKALLVDESGQVVSRTRLASGLRAGTGTFEHDAAATWWELPRRALSRVVGDQAGRVSAVAVCAPMPSLCAVGPGGRPIGPGLLYGDDRGQPVERDVSGSSSPGTAGEVGVDPTASTELVHMAAWAARQYPAADGYWPAQAVVNASVGGEGVLDLASAFASGPLYNGNSWDTAACQSIGIAAAGLPRVAVFGEVVGEVGPDVAAENGLTGTALVAGSVDGLCEQLVSGAVEDGDLLVTLGSTLLVWLCVPGWPDAAPGLWRVPHLAGGKALLGGASNAGGMWVDWVDRLLAAPEQGASELSPAHIPIWWPWSRGERVPMHDRGLRIGLAGADLGHGPAALRRAALEASAFVVRRIAELASRSGTPVKRVIVTGGGAARPGWAQAIADVSSLPVLALVTPESAALGAAFLARMGVQRGMGLEQAAHWARWQPQVDPDARWSEAADERYHRWLEGV